MRFKLAVGVIGCQADQRFSLVRKNKYFSLARGSVAYNFHFIVLCQLIGRDAVIQRHGAGAGYTPLGQLFYVMLNGSTVAACPAGHTAGLDIDLAACCWFGGVSSDEWRLGHGF